MKETSVLISTVVLLIMMIIYLIVDLKQQKKCNSPVMHTIRDHTIRDHTMRDHMMRDHPMRDHPMRDHMMRNHSMRDHTMREARKIGFLVSQEMSDSVILPLFGFRTLYRKHRYNYYTVTDAANVESSVKLPVIHRDRDCTEEIACEELYSGDIVRVHGYEQHFNVTIYH